MAGDVGAVPILAVASGKGGVGKTTVAVNLALALSAADRRVGIVDADLYGPDIPRMMGLRRPAAASSVTVYATGGIRGARLEAVDRYGVQLASAGFLIGEDQALGLHAGLAQAIVSRLIVQTAWAADTDCLVVDLPPGTADIQQLVFGQRARKVMVVVVVTPRWWRTRTSAGSSPNSAGIRRSPSAALRTWRASPARAAAAPLPCSRRPRTTRASGRG